MTQRNPLWELIEEALDARVDTFSKRRPGQADVARLSRVTDQTISKWKAAPRMPRPHHLASVADALSISYADALAAALAGQGYLPAGATIKVSTAGTGVSLVDFIDELLATAAGEADARDARRDAG